MSGPARVGVCIPVRGPVEPLEKLLKAVEGVDWPLRRGDVVVAVDGPDEALVQVARKWGADVVVVDPPGGSYLARNVALDRLSPDVEVVAFTDADCLPDPTWLSAHVAALSHADLSGGAVRVTRSDRPTPAEFVDSIRHLDQRTYVEVQGFAATCNLAVRRSVTDRLRFDGTLRTGGDADFGRRARAAGLRLVYSEQASIAHPARRTSAELMRKVNRICEGMPHQPDRWRGRELFWPRRNLWPWHRARREGIAAGPLWGLHASLLEYRAARRIVRAARRSGAIVVSRPD